jgi:hypothetical protein
MAEGEGGDGGGEKMVPYARLAEVIAERKELRGQIATLTTEIEAARKLGEVADGHARLAKEWEDKYTALDKKFARHRDLAGAGITDPEVSELAEWAYGRLPEQDRPAFGDALKAWKAKPDDAPVALRPFLAVQDPGGGGGGQAAGGTGAPGARALGGGQAGAGQFSAETIGRMTPEQYKANRDAILNGVRR